MKRAEDDFEIGQENPDRRKDQNEGLEKMVGQYKGRH